MDDLSGGEVLAAGTRLEEFEVERELGAGGFGVTYLAHDRSLDRQVAIKEYLPHDWATRHPDGAVGPWSATHAENYRWGLERFLEEARVLARLHHPHVVQVYRVIEARGTAYMVTEYVEGRSLAEALQADGPWREPRVLALLDALTSGLGPVHAAGLVHRDIKPANVMLRGDSSPVLIDFGAARQAAVLTPGYAPFEQYNTKGRQGPWTDVYALGAVAYEALSGRVPEEAPARMEDDTLRPVTEVAAHGVSSGCAAAIGAALALRGRDRPQSLAEWRSRLGLPSAGARGHAEARGHAGRHGRGYGGASANGAAGGTAERSPTASRRWRLAVAAVAAVALTVAGMVWLASGVAVPETGGARGVAERTGANSGAGSNAEDSVREAPAVPPEVVEEALGLDLAGWRRIQEGLVALGFDPGEPDGRVGGGTRRAVRSYQAGAGKPATGFLDETDVTRLRYAAADADRLAAEAERRRLAELRRPGRVFRDCDICPQMVVIPAGTFMMGSPASEEGRFDSEGPRHEVTLRSFALGVKEVTFDEWDACVRGGGCNGYRPDDEGWGRGVRPVINVDWNDTQAYVGWLSENTGAEVVPVVRTARGLH